jgi:hypothetical protein
MAPSGQRLSRPGCQSLAVNDTAFTATLANQATQVSSDLASVIETWSLLPLRIQEAITTLVDAVGRSGRSSCQISSPPCLTAGCESEPAAAIGASAGFETPPSTPALNRGRHLSAGPATSRFTPNLSRSCDITSGGSSCPNPQSELLFAISCEVNGDVLPELVRLGTFKHHRPRIIAGNVGRDETRPRGYCSCVVLDGLCVPFLN